MKQTTQRRPAGRQAARFAGASVSALAAMSMLAPMAFAQGIGGGDTVTPKPDKVWVLDAAGALVTADPNWTNTAGSDNKVFLPADGVAAVVDGKIPANLATDLTKYEITDDWTAAAKYVDFTDAAKAKVYLDGKDVTAQFDVKVDGTKTVATAKAEFLANTGGLAKDAVVKLVLSGNLRGDYDTDGKLVRFTNAGFETWNTRTEPSNVPAIFTWTPDPHKQVLASAYQGGDQSDINGLQVFPGQKIEYAVQVDLRIPDNLAWGTNAVKTLAVEDAYDPMFVPDKTSVEFWDARSQRVIPRTAYKLTWNDANHSFVADFDADWVKANVTSTTKGWLILRFDGQVKTEAKDGAIVKNQAFQIINGDKTTTEIPEVIIPSWTPHKEDLNTDLQNIDGKTVVQGDVLLYRLTLDGGPARSKLAYDVHKLGLVDDYDEAYLDLAAKDIQVLEKGTNADVTSKFNVQIKDGKVYVFAKLVDSTNVNGDAIKAVQPEDLAAFDAKAIDPINDAIIDQSLLGKQFFVLLPSKVNKEVDGYVIKNQARQNLENTWKDTEIVSNPLKDIDPAKDVVISEEKQDSINGTEVKLDSIFNYKLTTSTIPANRAYGSKQWSIVDKFNPQYDRYTGNWAIYADTDIWNGQTRIFKKGDLLADFAHHESETYKDFFKVTWDEKSYTFRVDATKKFMDILNTRTDLPQAWAAYVQMERVAPGDKITNVHTETYNDVERPSNEVFTKTFEHPAIVVSKFTLADGAEKGDRDFADQPHLISLADQIKAAGDVNGFGVKVGFTLTNTGDVNLKDVTLSDATEEGTTGTIKDISCTVPVEAAEAAALNAGSEAQAPKTVQVTGDKIAKLAKGQTVSCVGTLTGMKPGEAHTNTATAKGKSVFTGKEVSASDPWNAKAEDETPLVAPKIDVEKFTLDEGPTVGDRDTAETAYKLGSKDQAKPDAAAVWTAKDSFKIGYRITNSGNVPLKDVVLTDMVTKGSGKVSDLKCSIKDTDGKTVTVTGDKVGSMAVGDVVDCTGVLSGVLPEELHSNTAKVVGKSVLTDKETTDEDNWFAKAPGHPGIKVEKFTLSEGLPAGDRNTAAEALDVKIDQAVSKDGIKIGFKVTNTGDTALKDVQLSDKTIVGTGKVTSLACTVPVKGGGEPQASASPTATPSASASASASPTASASPSASASASPSASGTASPSASAPSASTQTVTGDKIGELAPGQSVECVGTLTGIVDLEKDAGKVVLHADTATVTASSKIDGVKVTDTDDWHASVTVPKSTDEPGKKPTEEPKGTQTGDQLLGNNSGAVAGGLAALLAALGLGGGWIARNRRRSAAAVAGAASDDQE